MIFGQGTDPSAYAAAAAAAAADAEKDPQENGKPSSTECIGMGSLHRGKDQKKEKLKKLTML